MKLEETVIETSGVYRCCLATVAQEYQDREVQLGATSQCQHCREPFTLVMKNGTPIWVPNWQQNGKFL